MDKGEALLLLDRLDAYRRRANEEGLSNPDHALRMAEAMIAELAGFRDRISWTGVLQSTQGTKYGEAYPN